MVIDGSMFIWFLFVLLMSGALYEASSIRRFNKVYNKRLEGERNNMSNVYYEGRKNKYRITRNDSGYRDTIIATITVDYLQGETLTRTFQYSIDQFNEVVDYYIEMSKYYRGFRGLEKFDNFKKIIGYHDNYPDGHTLDKLDIKFHDRYGIIWNVELNLNEEEHTNV